MVSGLAVSGVLGTKVQGLRSRESGQELRDLRVSEIEPWVQQSKVKGIEVSRSRESGMGSQELGIGSRSLGNGSRFPLLFFSFLSSLALT